QRARLPIAGIHADDLFEVRHRRIEAAGATVHLGRQTMALYVLRGRLQNCVDLGQRRLQLPVGEQALGQDEPGRRVVGPPLETVATEVDGGRGPAGLAIEVGELGEGKGIGIAREPLLVPADRLEQPAFLHYGSASPPVAGPVVALTGPGPLPLAPRWRDYTERPFWLSTRGRLL